MFVADIQTLCAKVGRGHDAILAITRGGLTPAHFLAEALDIRRIYAIGSIGYEDANKMGAPRIFNIPGIEAVSDVLIVDDIVDSGETMQTVVGTLRREYPAVSFRTAALFQKRDGVFQADFFVREATCWIDFFWSEDIQKGF